MAHSRVQHLTNLSIRMREESLSHRAVVFNRFTTSLGLAAFLILPIAGCTSSPVGQSFQGAFEADPRLKDNGAAIEAAQTPQPSSVAQTTQAQLPADFPAEIPIYPNRSLLEVDSNQPNQGVLTRWSSPDTSNQIVAFYLQELQKNGWTLNGQPIDKAQGTFEASREGLQAIIAVQPNSQTENSAGFSIQTSQTRPTQSASPNASVPQPGSSEFIGPIPQTAATASTSAPVTSAPQTFTDLDKAPKELSQYAKDLSNLGVLSLSSGNKSGSKTLFEPNKTITRRDYARWLVAANNRIYSNRPARQIRLGVETSQPAFQDVSRTDPDFSAIQGLAEAGLISSSLSGDSTTVLFRPDASLSREDLILWKVPIDTRQPLPSATIEAVKQTWGFQDAARTDSKALRAVLADFQNGDQANIRRAFGYTTLFQPKRTVTRAEAAAVLWYFGFQGDGLSATEALKAVARSNP